MTQQLRKAVFEAQVAGKIDGKAAALVRAEIEAEKTADKVRNLEALKNALQAIVGLWHRPCFICEDSGYCVHREGELVARWERGHFK